MSSKTCCLQHSSTKPATKYLSLLQYNTNNNSSSIPPIPHMRIAQDASEIKRQSMQCSNIGCFDQEVIPSNKQQRVTDPPTRGYHHQLTPKKYQQFPLYIPCHTIPSHDIPTLFPPFLAN